MTDCQRLACCNWQPMPGRSAERDRETFEGSQQDHEQLQCLPTGESQTTAACRTAAPTNDHEQSVQCHAWGYGLPGSHFIGLECTFS